MGVGRLSADPTILDPRALISWSDDGGSRWSSPLSRTLGRQGETRTRLTLLRTGMTGVQGRIWRIDVSDPVYCALLGGRWRSTRGPNEHAPPSERPGPRNDVGGTLAREWFVFLSALLAVVVDHEARISALEAKAK